MSDAGRAVARVAIERVRGAKRMRRKDDLAVEEPLEVRLRHGPSRARTEASLGLTMRTPGADEELVAGLLVSEGIVHERRDLARFSHGLDRDGHPDVNLLIAELRPGVAYDASSWDRTTVRSSACGVCGRATLDALRAHAPAASSAVWRVADGALRRLPEALRGAQAVFATTGGLHAAALFDANGVVGKVREDVGRHNAVDKLVGAAFLETRLPVRKQGLLVSGRVGYEILQKAAMAGMPIVAALGAPTSLAVDLAAEFDVTLVGFLRKDGYNVYAGAQRVRARPPPRKG